MRYLIKTLILSLLITQIGFAIDITELGDFSSRSLIMQKANKMQLDRQLNDLLKEKKLTPDINCLIAEIDKNNIENVELLLRTNINLNQNLFTDYPIYRAVKNNNFEMVKMLYENGAKLDKGFFSELYTAVKNKNHEMADYLIENGARVDYIDMVTNNSILYLSLKNNMTDISKKLIKNGANIDYKSLNLIKKKKINLDELSDNLN